MSDGVPPIAGGSRESGSTGEMQNIYSGTTLILLAMIALGISFYHPGPAGLFGPIMWPRVFSLLIVLAGVGVASGQLRVRNPKDFFGGVALIGLALVAMLASIDLPGMRGFAFGPGTAPRLFAILLAVLGGAVSVGGLLFEGPPLERYVFRGPIFLTGSVLIFAATIRPLGLILSSFATIIASAAATPDVKWRETVIWAVILTAFCALLFPYALNLPFQLWPRF
jgi:putative tricarboxylic transport membrane protein